MEKETAPSLLISFVFLKEFLEAREKYHYRDWALDSGAFSAWTRGIIIDLDEYIELCKELLETEPNLTEVFALDVIDDYKQTLKNTEKMLDAGVNAIPTYHFGEPEKHLKDLAKHFDKIAIGGVARKKGKIKDDFARACFSRVWPKKIHGFGYGSETHIMKYPFHSTDATNWELGPCGFGRWNAFGNMSVRGSNQNLRAEVEYYLKLERQARSRFKKEMALLEELEPITHPKLRLALATNESSVKTRCSRALNNPKVRLAVLPTGQEVKALAKKKGAKK